MTTGQIDETRRPLGRTGGPKLRAGLNAFSFNGALQAGEMTMFEVLDFCVGHEIDGLDATGYYFPNYPAVPPASYLNEFKRRAFVSGIEINGTGIRNDFAQRDAARRAADVELIKDWVEVAARLGAPHLRVFAGAEQAGQDWNQVADWMATDLRECAEYGKRFGVMLGIQNHGDFLKTAEQTLELVRRVDHEWLGVIVDTGHFTTPDPYDDIARLAPHAVSWQIKEKTDGKDGTVSSDFGRVVKIAREAGYRGYLPIETLAPDGVQYDPAARVIEVLTELREALR